MARKDISAGLRFKVFHRDSFTCQYCGRSAPDVVLHVDHVVPVSKGGTNSIENLVTACAECNLGKSDMSLRDVTEEEARRFRERLRNIGRFNCVVAVLEERWRAGCGVSVDGR